MHGRARIAIAAFCAAAASVALGFFTLFSTFAATDDEGYFLTTVKGYLGGARLYDDLVSSYGPFFWEITTVGLKVFGVSNDGGRLFTLLLWVGTAVLLALATRRLTGSTVLAVLTYLVAFRVLSFAPSEPTHPGHLLMLLLAAAVALAAHLADTRPHLGFALIGAVGAAAALSKVNVGGLLLVAAALVAVLASAPLAQSALIRGVAVGAFVLVPLALVSRNLNTYGYALYAVHVALCAAAVAVVVLARRDARVAGFGVVGALVAGALALVVIVVVAVLAQGTSLSALVQSIVVDASKQSNIFGTPPFLRERILGWDAAAIAAAVAATTARTVPPLLAGVLRIGAGIAIWVSVLGIHQLELPLALAWIVALPGGRARLFLAAVAVLAALHGYPVAGSQIVWSALLFVPVGAVCIADGAAAFTDASLRVAGGIGLAIWVALAVIAFPLGLAVRDYRAGVSLGEPGASWIHIPSARAEPYQWIAREVRARCSTFVASPGFGSLSLWTHTTPPAWAPGSAWMFVLDDAAQEKIVRAADASPRLCGVRNPGVEQFWAQGRTIPERPLYRLITQRLHVVARDGVFELRTAK